MDPAVILALHLMALTGPDGQLVVLNPEHVVSIREKRDNEEHFARGVNCLIHTDDGKFLGVRENCMRVREIFNEAERSE